VGGVSLPSDLSPGFLYQYQKKKKTKKNKGGTFRVLVYFLIVYLPSSKYELLARRGFSLFYFFMFLSTY
jgi:hypothetical protein